MLRIIAALAMFVLATTGQHLDQFTEETGSFRNMPQGKMWQVCFGDDLFFFVQ